MSIYDIRKKFNLVIAPESRSISYVRYYNFNSATVTDIPMYMENIDTDTPITVNISTTKPWMVVVDPETGNDLRFPSGNVVLPPSSSKSLLLKIDLPPEIENELKSDLYENVIVKITSGSAPIIRPTNTDGTTSNDNPKNTIVTDRSEYLIQYGKRMTIAGISVYDANGNLDPTAEVTWVSDKPNYVRVLDANEDNPQIREVRAPKPTIILGERRAKITLTAGDRTTSFTVKVKRRVSQAIMDSYGQPTGTTSGVSTAEDDVEAEEESTNSGNDGTAV